MRISRSERRMMYNVRRKKRRIILVCVLAVAIASVFCYQFFINNADKEGVYPLVKIGYSSFPYPPLHYYDEDKELTGFDVGLARAAAEIMRVEPEFVPIDWSKSAELLLSGEVDMLWGGLERASLDEKVIKFTKSYLRSNIVLLMPEDRDYEKFEDLEGLSICALNFTPAYNYLRVYNRDVIKSKRSFTPPEYQSLMGALSTGEFDCMITDTSFAAFFLKANPGEAVKMSDTVIGSNYAVAVRADDKKLFDLLQGALDELEAGGVINSLRDRWIGN